MPSRVNQPALKQGVSRERGQTAKKIPLPYREKRRIVFKGIFSRSDGFFCFAHKIITQIKKTLKKGLKCFLSYEQLCILNRKSHGRSVKPGKKQKPEHKQKPRAEGGCMVSGGSWRAEPPPIAGGLNQSQSQSRGRGLEVTVRYRASVSDWQK